MIAAMLLTSCAGIPAAVRQQPFVIGVVFQNHTRDTLKDVRLSLIDASGFVSCSAIIAGSACATTFLQRRYQRSRLSVTWVRAGRAETSGAFVLSLPKPLPKNRPLTAVISIGGARGFDAALRPRYGL